MEPDEGPSSSDPSQNNEQADGESDVSSEIRERSRSSIASEKYPRLRLVGASSTTLRAPLRRLSEGQSEFLSSAEVSINFHPPAAQNVNGSNEEKLPAKEADIEDPSEGISERSGSCLSSLECDKHGNKILSAGYHYRRSSRVGQIRSAIDNTIETSQSLPGAYSVESPDHPADLGLPYGHTAHARDQSDNVFFI